VSTWQRQGANAKRKDYPKPIRRPWEPDEHVHLSPNDLKSPDALDRNGVIGSAVSMEDARDRLTALNGRAPAIR